MPFLNINRPFDSGFWTMSPFYFFSSIIMEFDESTYPIVLPDIQEELGISMTMAEWLLTAFSIGSAAGSIPTMKFCAEYGFKLCAIVYVLLLIALYAVSYFLADEFLILVFVRFAIGFTSSGLHGFRNATSSLYAREDETERCIKNTIVLKQILTFICPLIGPLVLDLIGWKAILCFPAIFAIISLPLIFMFGEYKEVQKEPNFDWIGTISLTILMVMINILFVVLGDFGWIRFIVTLIICVISVVAFVYAELAAANPILPMFMLHSPYSDALTMHIANNMNQNTNFMVNPQVLEICFGMSAGTIGWISSANQVLSIFVTMLINWIDGKFVFRLLFPILYIGIIIFQILYCGTIFNMYTVIIFYFILNQFACSTNEAGYALILCSVPPELTQYAAGFPCCGRTIGNSISTTLSAVLIDSFARIAEEEEWAIEPTQAGAIAAIAMEAILIIIVGLIAYFHLGNTSFESGKRGFRADKLNDIECERKETKGDYERIDSEENA